MTGKTWTEVVIAKHLWLAGYSPLFVSLEMPPAKMYRRLDAAYAKMDYRNLRKGQLGMVAEPVYKAALDSLKGKHPLHVVTRVRVKTVQDIAILIEELKPKATIIDGMYKLRVPGVRGQAALWERMMEIIDQLQELAQSKEHPILASTQFSRQVRKGQTKAELGMLAFADAIGMNADVIVGLLPSNQMRSDRETLMRILKNREDDLAAFRSKFNTLTQEYDEIGPWYDVDDEDEDDDATGTSTEADFT
jgi:replicative DNA helicase